MPTAEVDPMDLLIPRLRVDKVSYDLALYSKSICIALDMILSSFMHRMIHILHFTWSSLMVSVWLNQNALQCRPLAEGLILQDKAVDWVLRRRAIQLEQEVNISSLSLKWTFLGCQSLRLLLWLLFQMKILPRRGHGYRNQRIRRQDENHCTQQSTPHIALPSSIEWLLESVTQKDSLVTHRW